MGLVENPYLSSRDLIRLCLSAWLHNAIFPPNALIHEPEKGAAAKLLAQLLQQSGVLVLAETVPRYTQRLYRLLEKSKLDADLYQRLVAAEEAIYSDKLDPIDLSGNLESSPYLARAAVCASATANASIRVRGGYC